MFSYAFCVVAPSLSTSEEEEEVQLLSITNFDNLKQLLSHQTVRCQGPALQFENEARIFAEAVAARTAALLSH